MGFLAGKKLLITGVLSNRSIAYGIAEAMKREGAELAFTYQTEKFEDRVTKLAAYRIIADQAAGLVVHGGRVLIEAGEGQVTDISKLLSAAGFAVGGPWKDLGGIDRIVPATH